MSVPPRSTKPSTTTTAATSKTTTSSMKVLGLIAAFLSSFWLLAVLIPRLWGRSDGH